VSAATAVGALFRAMSDGPPQQLSYLKKGSGAGSVALAADGMSVTCDASCAQSYGLGTTVTLTAAPAYGSALASWSGVCKGHKASCSVRMCAAKTVAATFTALPVFTLAYIKSGTGEGAVDIGVAPAILLFVWSLNSLRTLGWVIALVLAICCALRLARFNVALDDPNKPAWTSRFFTGAPAPAGAGLALLPFYLGFLGIIDEGHGWALLIGPYVVGVALLMVSRVPTFSGKHLGRIRGDMVLPVLGLAVLAVVMLIAYPWEFLSIVSIIYLALIPVSIRSHRRHLAADARRLAEAAPAS
jgi:phosphatidylserine synthase